MGREDEVYEFTESFVEDEYVSNGYYYADGYGKEEKIADVVYRFKGNRFERYFLREEIWKEAPEERIILKERKARYIYLAEEEAMALSLSV